MARVQITHPVDGGEPVLDVVLSERNLLSLLSKLYFPGSARSIGVGDAPDGFAEVLLRAEPDAVHYATRDGSERGQLHPLTDIVLISVRQAIAEFLRRPENVDERPVAWLWPDLPEEEL